MADFPEGVESPVSYGNNIETLIGYFHARQYTPFKQMKEIMGAVFNINISQGGIHYLLNRFSNKVTPIYEIIRQRIACSSIVGADESGVKANGDKHRFWHGRPHYLPILLTLILEEKLLLMLILQRVSQSNFDGRWMET